MNDVLQYKYTGAIYNHATKRCGILSREHKNFGMNKANDMPHVASLLGLDASSEPQYLWIAQMAAHSQVDPHEWKEFTNDRGQVMYYNLKLKV